MKYLKNLLLILFTVFIGFGANAMTANTAFAVDYIDSATFLELDFDSQVSIIKEAQLMAIKYESLDIEHAKKKRLKKYVNNLLNILISSAHAKKLSASEVGDICIYAGWISVYDGDKCTHPFNTNDSSFDEILAQVKDLQVKDLIKQTRLANAAFRKANTKCAETGKILCAPSLFGLNENKEPFCATGNEDTVNSSYDCFKQIEKLDKAKKNAVYKNIIDQVAGSDYANHSNLMNMFKIYYDICMCKGDANYINKNYAEKMFGQRTCYAWILQTERILDNFKNTPGLCNTLSGKPGADEDSINQMFNWLNAAQKNISGVIEHSSIKPEDLFTKNTKNSEINQLWLEARQKAEDDYKLKTKYNTCPIQVPTKENPVKPEPNTDEVFACVIKNEKIEIKDDKDNNKDAKEEVEVTKSDEDKTIPENEKEAEVTQKNSPTQEPDSDEGVQDLIFNDGDYRLIGEIGDEKYKDAKKVFTWTNAEQSPIEGTPELAKLAKPKEDIEVSLSIDIAVEGQAKPVKYACKMTFSADKTGDDNPPAKKDYGIKAKLAKNEDKTVQVMAIVSVDGKEITDLEDEGLKVVWTFKDVEPKDKKTDKKKNEEDPEVGLETEDDGEDLKPKPTTTTVDVMQEDEDEDEDKPNTSKEVEGLTADKDKKKVKQIATAHLIKEGLTPREAAVDIPKIAVDESPAKGPRNNNPQLRGPAKAPNLQRPQNYGLRGIR